MKTSRLKLSDRTNHTTGFTLIELLVSIVIMGIIASFISYAVSSMITSNQSLAKEQNRRVEASRAIDLIANDVRVSKIIPAALPTGAGSGAVAVLSMDIFTGGCSNSAKNRITYFIQPVAAGSTTEIGPNVLYRYGLISGANGNIDCSAATTFPDTSTPANNYTPIADAIYLDTPNVPTCNAPSGLIGTTGFYSCVNNVATPQLDSQQVSVSLFSKLSGNKIYGINRVINSGFIPDTATATTNDCTVPDLTSSTATANTPALANNAIRDAVPVPTSPVNTALDAANAALANKLLRNGINLENGSTVLTQNPLAGAKLPCGQGLVTYTY